MRLANLACKDLFSESAIQKGPRPEKVTVESGSSPSVRVHFTQVNGKLVCEGRLSGFSIRNATSEELPILYHQVLDGKNPSDVQLFVQVDWQSKAIPDTLYLWYGYGTNPYCNLRDELNLAAPAFGPIKIIKP
jgi:sialate O-acetylesterase